MSRQLQMTQLSKQNSAPKVEKHSSLPFSVSATRVAFPGTSAASPTLRRMVVGNLQSSLEPRTVMPVKPARRYSLEPPKDHRLGPQTLGWFRASCLDFFRETLEVTSITWYRIRRLLSANTWTGRGRAFRGPYSTGVPRQADSPGWHSHRDLFIRLGLHFIDVMRL